MVRYEATKKELISTFNRTCEVYVHLTGPEFLSKLDRGLVDPDDVQVQKVLRRLGYVRPGHQLVLRPLC